MNEFPQWCATQTWTTSVREILTKLWNQTESDVVAYDHPGCHRTSNAVDRPMNRLCRLMSASRGLHGHQSSSELRLRGWALLRNFRPDAPRSNQPRTCRVRRVFDDAPPRENRGTKRVFATYPTRLQTRPEGAGQVRQGNALSGFSRRKPILRHSSLRR